MIEYSLSEIKPGMTLSKPVYDFHDVLLLKAGTELTPKTMHLLKSWGINRVWVAGQDDRQTAARDVQQEVRIQETVTKYLQAKFDGVLDDPIMVTIMETAGALITRRYLNRAEENEIE
jgi:hypothetical protein